MKKFFSLIAAVLFAGSMMAIDFTLSSAESVTQEGVTVTFAKGSGSTAPAWYDNGLRLYASNEVTISSESNITGITFNWQKQGTKAFNTATASVGEYTHPEAAGEGVWTGSATSVTFTLGTSGQLLLNTFSVTLEGEVPPTPADIYTVAGNDAAIFGEAWNPALAANDMKKVNGIYKWEKAELNLTAGTIIAFKVAKNHSWDVAYPDQNDTVTIAEEGEYTLTIIFDPDIEAVAAKAVKKEIPVIPQYEVAEAIAAGLAEGDEVLVRGVISKMQIKGKNFAKYGSVNIFVTDATDAEGEFEFFNCFSFNADTFRTTTPAYDAEGTTWEDLKKVADENGNEFRLGDTIVALGKYQYYNQKTHQLQQGCYIVDLKPAPVAPAQDVEVTLSSLTTPGALIWTDYVAEEGWWQIMGANEACDFSISNVKTTETAGVYTIADLDADYSYISIYGENDTTDVAFVDGSVTVAVSAEGIVTVNGTLVGSDGNNYIFNLTYKDPTAENTVNVAISEWELVDDYVDYLGLFAVAGEDANGTYVQLALYLPDEATEIAGDYTEEDFDLQYFGSYVADANDGYRIFSATIKVVQNEAGEVFVTADILCYNNTLYKVTTPAGQGLSNTAVETKATKSLRNGILVIEKAGVKYNAQGAVVR